jgi:hypothetical protein
LEYCSRDRHRLFGLPRVPVLRRIGVGASAKFAGLPASRRPAQGSPALVPIARHHTARRNRTHQRPSWSRAGATDHQALAGTFATVTRASVDPILDPNSAQRNRIRRTRRTGEGQGGPANPMQLYRIILADTDPGDFQDRCLKPLGHPSVFGVQRLSRGVRSGKVSIAAEMPRRCGAAASRQSRAPRLAPD